MRGGDRLGERQRQASGQPVSGRLDRDCGQRTAEIGFIERRHSQAGPSGVDEDAAERELVRSGNKNQGGGRGVPGGDDTGKDDSELKGRVRGLTCLGCGRQVGSGDEIEPA
jgi:hypothetical protein